TSPLRRGSRDGVAIIRASAPVPAWIASSLATTPPAIDGPPERAAAIASAVLRSDRAVAPKPQNVSGEWRAAASPTSATRGPGDAGAGPRRDQPGMYPNVGRTRRASPRL